MMKQTQTLDNALKHIDLLINQQKENKEGEKHFNTVKNNNKLKSRNKTKNK